MKSQHYYSASWNNFFELPEDADELPSEWPVDVVAVTGMDYQQLQAGVKTGKIIVPDDAGKPVLSWRYHYSASRQGFYPVDDKREYESGAGWPDDAIPVSDSDYKAMFDAQAQGKIIKPDDSGYPVVSEPVIDYVATAEAERTSRMSVATLRINNLVEAQDDGDIADAELAELTALREYRTKLRRLDVSNAPDVEWPAYPA
ncbi:tail fiber assembly protein [Citrobacter freundii]|uniref:tail fiber assembly protein n=3 Tax=Citrobacter freundii TaxID=546 RepID=UPI0022489073|nr:tail fiber assembly protein [Citrobacter freundii]UZQ88442.1 tail fiber assembly protein [Citrobacter freundii]UZQ94780.1 tail fiber assembly protein [Citrobacter freundii]UZQ99286.1 tail fiber assembly protein [Citrobacter freundii]